MSTAVPDWGEVLAAQGISTETIAAAREQAARHSETGNALAQDPLQAADPTRFHALLAREAEKAPATSGPPETLGPDLPDDTFGASVEQIAALVKARKVSAVELAERHLEALETTGHALNAVARTEPAAAIAQARTIDAALARGEDPGRLVGVPLAHKDLYAREGWLLEAGSLVLKGHIAPVTATSIAALDRAGALDIARLNTVEFALGPDGRNVHTGPVRNPWNTKHVPGGSSSGSGAAVAAGIVPAALGSDTGGSIRLPAAACGLVGLKPTAGLIGRSGIVPLSGSLDTAGPLCRSVRDAALLTQFMAGADAGDPQSMARPHVDLMAGIEDGLAGLRIGIPDSYFFDPLDAHAMAQIEAAKTLIEAEGATLHAVTLPGIELANRLNVIVINVEAAAQHRPWLATRAAEYGPETLGRMAAGLFVTGSAYLAALGHRAALLARVLEGPLAQVDAILAPAWPFEPPPIEGHSPASYARSVEQTGHCTRPANYLGLPAVTLPCGLGPNGVPLAIQLIARAFAEQTLLRAARGFERARRFLEEHRPGVFARV